MEKCDEGFNGATIFAIALCALVLFGALLVDLNETRKEEKEAAAKTATAEKEAAEYDAAYADTEGEARSAFTAWERESTGDNGREVVFRGNKARVLFVTYHKANPWRGDEHRHGFKTPRWKIWAETPSGRLFTVEYDPKSKEFDNFTTKVTRTDVVSAARQAGQQISESTFTRLPGRDA